MNSNDPRHPWARLVAAARHAPDERDTAAPYGFATRVAAQALAAGRPRTAWLDRFALRALGVASLLAIASIAVNYSIVAQSPKAAPVVEDDTQFAPIEDPVTVLLDA